MKSWICWATKLAVAIGWVAAAQAQQFNGPPVGSPGVAAPAPVARPAPPPSAIALLDVGMVFDKHNRFQAEMNAMKAEVKGFEDFLRNEQTQLQAQAEKLKQYQPGTDPFKQLEEQILIKSNDLKTKTQIKRKEFLEREADAYFRVYREIESVVNQFSQRNGIALVLRYSNQAINQKDRDSVLRGINRPIVYSQPSLDITTTILAYLNPPGSAAPAPPVGPGPGPGPGRDPSATRYPAPQGNGGQFGPK